MALNNQLQKYLRRFTSFWLNWPVNDFLLVIPPPRSPYKRSCKHQVQDHAENLEE